MRESKRQQAGTARTGRSEQTTASENKREQERERSNGGSQNTREKTQPEQAGVSQDKREKPNQGKRQQVRVGDNKREAKKKPVQAKTRENKSK